jgi:hypothetical protein
LIDLKINVLIAYARFFARVKKLQQGVLNEGVNEKLPFSLDSPSQESPAFTHGEEWRVLSCGLGWMELFTDITLDILCEIL